MRAVKVLPKGQITIPGSIRKKLDIKIGDALLIEEARDKIVLKKGKTIHDFKGTLPVPKGAIDKIIEQATGEAVKDRA